ncbi:uncharacterized protein LOC120254972 [Dioscorea cayenensis subsp. rotundata]|uniref:Uncharacterized protein LOC120254972 n=1 Tax=Dioscorea cayennensis subsp. rotundata TaxID=55577 RepID=A0AB40AW80_DIOCR|nr:uncharacterized protein LOC120254972 [Dioscorea cayenensis subsp. rotundata]
MKASLKFREDQKPLVRAKIPISIFGLPFLSGFSAGDTRELRLDLATAFDSGPSLRASYRPNDPLNPFTLSLRTGVGARGSPTAAPMTITAEFNLLSRSSSSSLHSFSILFKPRLGDFSLKKCIDSTTISRPIKSTVDKADDSDHDGTPRKGMLGMISGTEVAASSMMPLRGSAAVRFRWGLKLPAELQTAFSDRDRTAGIPFARIPLLVMSKISIEHVATDTKVKKTKAEEPDDVAKGSGDVAQTCSLIRRQLEALRAENGAMSNALEEIRKEVGVADVAKREMCVADVAKRETRGAPPMPSPEELTQELAKALKK